MASHRYFPYVYNREENLERYLRFRCEGRSLFSLICNSVSYYRKYRLKKTTAPAEEVQYFDHQRRLLAFLSGKEAVRSGFAQNYETRLAMVGDLMWLRDGWKTFLTPEVLNYLNDLDVVLGNLETVVSKDRRVPSLLPDYPRYNSDPDLVRSFHRPDGKNTFTALSTANNHILDHGDPGALDTRAFLDGEGILHSGIGPPDDKPYVTFTVNDVKFGFYAVTWGVNRPGQLARSRLRLNLLKGIAPEVDKTVDVTPIKDVLADMASDGVDFKIVSLHWGFKFEVFPDPKLMLIGREIIRQGADVLMGSHPHLRQPLEVCFVNGYEKRYRGLEHFFPAMNLKGGCILNSKDNVPRKGLIVYSLGNFTTAMYTAECQTGLVQSIHVGRDPKTGRADWDLPESRSVLNVPKDPATGVRKLVLQDAAAPGSMADIRLPV